MRTDHIGRAMEILLVEDGLVDARAAIGILERGGIKHRLTLVRDGVEALDFLRRSDRFARAPRPDLILLDLELPKKDGLEVLAELKRDEDLKTIPVVVLTSSEDYEDIQRCQDLQVDAYITKPVNMAKFLEVIKKLKNFWHADLILPQLD